MDQTPTTSHQSRRASNSSTSKRITMIGLVEPQARPQPKSKESRKRPPVRHATSAAVTTSEERVTRDVRRSSIERDGEKIPSLEEPVANIRSMNVLIQRKEVHLPQQLAASSSSSSNASSGRRGRLSIVNHHSSLPSHSQEHPQQEGIAALHAEIQELLHECHHELELMYVNSVANRGEGRRFCLIRFVCLRRRHRMGAGWNEKRESNRSSKLA